MKAKPTAYDLEALNEVWKRAGGHLLNGDLGGDPRAPWSGGRNYWKGKASDVPWPVLVGHVSQGGGYGLVPARLGLFCLDVDGPGDAALDALVAQYPAAVVYASWSQRPGRGHAFYDPPPEAEDVGQVKFRVELEDLPAAGEVRWDQGYVAVPSWGVDALANRLNDGLASGTCPPLEVVKAAESGKGKGRGRPRNAVRTQPRASGIVRNKLNGLYQAVEAAAEGERNQMLYWAACRAGEVVEGGHVAAAVVEAELTSAGLRVGLQPAEVFQTIRSGLTTGRQAGPWIPGEAWRSPEGGQPADVGDGQPADVGDGQPADVGDQAEDGRPASVVSELAFDAPPPDVLVEREHDGADLHAVLVRGDVAVLTGPGKAGKSTIVAGLVREAGRPEGGTAFGLRIESSKVLLCSLEDIPWNVARHYGHYGEREDYVGHVRECRPPGRLWELADGGSQGSADGWALLEAAVDEWAPDVLVVDTVAHAFPAAGPETVAEFIGALRRLAQDKGLGVLLVAHCTKAAQRDLLEGKTWIDDSIVAGGAQWVYSPRAVLVAHRVGKPFRAILGKDAVLVRAHYANVGPAGWGVLVEPRYDADGRYQGLDSDPLDRYDDVEDVLDQLKPADERKAKADVLAGSLKDWLVPAPGKMVGADDLRLAFIKATKADVTRNRFTDLMAKLGHERSRGRFVDASGKSRSGTYYSDVLGGSS